MRLPSELSTEITNTQCFGDLDDQPSHLRHNSVGNVPTPPLSEFRLPWANLDLGLILSNLSAVLLFFGICIGYHDVIGQERPLATKHVRLHSPWQREMAPESSFEISVDGSRLSISGEVVDEDTVGEVEGREAEGRGAERNLESDHEINDCILFAWSLSPLGLDFDGVEILPNGQFKTFQKEPSEKEIESASHIQPKLRVNKTTNGYRFDCEIVIRETKVPGSANDAPLYISLSQIDASRGGESTRWYCSSVPATSLPERMHSSSFAMLDSFPSEKREVVVGEALMISRFRLAEFELRNKWNDYATQPSILGLTQKWYEDIAGFPDAEPYLERTRVGAKLQAIDVSEVRAPSKLTDARSAKVKQLFGQSWSMHLGDLEGLSTSLPLSIETSTSNDAETHIESLVMWQKNNRIHVALLQNGEGVYWGSASIFSEHTDQFERVKSIDFASDGSTNGIGYELYANSEPLELITHNASNLRIETESPHDFGPRSTIGIGEWEIKTANTGLKVDLYNTKLTPIEMLSLDSNSMLLSWSELTEDQREAWRLHYLLCVDLEGRYFLESLKHYTSSQAELLRRSGKPAKK